MATTVVVPQANKKGNNLPSMLTGTHKIDHCQVWLTAGDSTSIRSKDARNSMSYSTQEFMLRKSKGENNSPLTASRTLTLNCRRLSNHLAQGFEAQEKMQVKNISLLFQKYKVQTKYLNFYSDRFTFLIKERRLLGLAVEYFDYE